jgi:hypothetical protein
MTVSPALDFYEPYGPGFLIGRTIAVPGGHSGDIADVYVRVFQGPNYDSALTKARAGPFPVRLVEAPGAPDTLYLPPGSLDMCIPEPKTAALLGLGIITLWLAIGQRMTATGRAEKHRLGSRVAGANYAATGNGRPGTSGSHTNKGVSPGEYDIPLDALSGTAAVFGHGEEAASAISRSDLPRDEPG